MAVVAISDSILTDIADAIRSKNGTANTYKPSQMPDAIEAISGGGITPTGTIEITQNGVVDVTNYASADVDVPTGSTPVINSLSVTENGTYTAPTGVDGYSPITVNVPQGITPTGTKQISITQNGTTTEDVTNYADAEITVNVSGSIDYLAKRMNGDTFIYHSDEVTNFKNSSLRECKTIIGLVLPNLATVENAYYGCASCTNLVYTDWGKGDRIPNNHFNGCTKMNLLILRRSSVVTLGQINAFGGTPFASGNAGGTLYVPSALISSYQSASNWSTILGYETNSIQAIEGSIYETQYADGTSIPS